MSDYFVHESAYVDQPCEIGAGSSIWHFSHVMKNTKLGENCILGQNVHVAPGVEIGSNVKIQNNVSLYTGCIVEDDVFLGPSCVLTNVTNPRCEIKRHDEYKSTILRRGATIGANSTIVCGTEIGRFAFVAAGCVVTKDVPDYALMTGVPGRRSGWWSRHGYRLPAADSDGILTCPGSGLRYRQTGPDELVCLDLDPAEALAA